MHRVIVRLLPVFLTALVLAPAAHAQDTEIRYLSGTDNTHTVPWEFVVSGGRRAGERTTIPVPSNWELQGFGTYNYGQDKQKGDERGEYRHSFELPASWRNRRIVLVFEGSMTDTTVRVNGVSAGPVHQGGFYEFSYDVTRLVRIGTRNVLEVTVSKQSADPSINRAERNGDFWVFGGIFRPVYLAAFPSESIDRVAVDARADGTLRIDAFLHSSTTADRVTAQVETLDGAPVGGPFTATLGASRDRVRLETRIDHPRLWTSETPHLYRVRVELARGSTPLHVVRERFGFRTVEVRPGDGIYVNGSRVLLKGANRHSFWPETGRTTSRAISEQDVRLMKDMNMNAVRMSHYPPDRHFLDVCDELGLYVLDELTGWQANYDTAPGTRLVGELVRRDVNHPSILFWDNGNEGGFNRDLDGEFATWDPQGRLVLHPWENFNGIDTLHYPAWDCCVGQFFHGRDLIMPTEFLHGLYDGGLGAGLRDYWERIVHHPLGAGGFLWAFADEGIVRTDQDGRIDTKGNLAPDGIVGPHREKEASYWTIKKLWSPVWIDLAGVPASFDGRITVENRYAFTNLSRIRFAWSLDHVRLSPKAPAMPHWNGVVSGPDAGPGARGVVTLPLPDNWRQADVLQLSALDEDDHEIATWRWMLKSAPVYAHREPSDGDSSTSPVVFEDRGPVWALTARSPKVTTVLIDPATGRLQGVTSAGVRVRLTNGPRPTLEGSTLDSITHFASGDTQVVEATYKGALTRVRWTFSPSGELGCEYQLRIPDGEYPFFGVTFDYPDDEVTGLEWVGDGPTRVWKNRLDGVMPGLWTSTANDTMTGASWTYPEFRGYYANVYVARIKTRDGAINMVMHTDGLFLRMLTPHFPTDARYAQAPFPDGSISLLQAIPPIGTKFRPPTQLGPSGQPNVVNGRTGVYDVRVTFAFEN